MVARPVDQAVAAGARDQDVLARAAVGQAFPGRRARGALRVEDGRVVEAPVHVQAGPQVDQVVRPAAVCAHTAHAADDPGGSEVAEDRVVAGCRLGRVGGVGRPLGGHRYARLGRVEVKDPRQAAQARLAQRAGRRE